MNLRSAYTLAKDAVSSWVADFAPSMGAALAYYTVFSMAPLVLIVIAIAGLIFGGDAARNALFGELKDMMGDQGAQAVQSMVASADKPMEGVVSTVVGVVVLIVGATTVFGELQASLDRIWRAPARNQPSGIWGLLRTRFLSFGMILGIGFLLMVSLVLSASLAALGKWYGGLFGGWHLLATLVNFLVSFGLVTVLFALIYKFMPSVKVHWHDVWIGAGVTALLFSIGKFAIGLYIGRTSAASGFGAAGSLVVLLLWVYYSAQIFLLGAEFTWVYAHTFGSKKGEARAAPAEVPQKGVDVQPPPPAATPPLRLAPPAVVVPRTAVSSGGMIGRAANWARDDPVAGFAAGAAAGAVLRLALVVFARKPSPRHRRQT